MLGIPGEMDQDLRLHLGEDLRAREQVGLVPDDPGLGGAGGAGDGVDLVAGQRERGQRMASDEAAGAGEQHPAHGWKSGWVRSRGEIVRPPGGAGGHAMANAGSSQRTARTASGT